MEVGFVGVGNDGRSLMAAAFADAELTDRGIDDVIETVADGTDSTEQPGQPVLEAIHEVGLDTPEESPAVMEREELEQLDLVVIVGCEAASLGCADIDVDCREWQLADPSGKELGAVRSIREDVATRVRELVNELETAVARPPA